MTQNGRRKVFATIGLVAVVSIGVMATQAQRALSRAPDRVYLPVVALGLSSDPSVNDCSHLSNGIKDSSEPQVGVSVAQWVAASSAVAQTLVASEQQARFNTPAGLPPTQEPPDEDEDGAMIFRPVVLTVSHLYKGDPAITGYVVPKWGGTSALCPDYTYGREPEMMSASPGNNGVVFLYDPPGRWVTAPPVWYSQLKAVADALGSNYKVMLPHNWYRYSGTNAVSTWSMETKTILQLTSEIEAAIGP